MLGFLCNFQFGSWQKRFLFVVSIACTYCCILFTPWTISPLASLTNFSSPSLADFFPPFSTTAEPHLRLYKTYIAESYCRRHVAVGDPGEGPLGPPPPLTFRPNWGLKGQKIFQTTPTPYVRVWMTGLPPPLSEGLDPLLLTVFYNIRFLSTFMI